MLVHAHAQGRAHDHMCWCVPMPMVGHMITHLYMPMLGHMITHVCMPTVGTCVVCTCLYVVCFVHACMYVPVCTQMLMNVCMLLCAPVHLCAGVLRYRGQLQGRKEPPWALWTPRMLRPSCLAVFAHEDVPARRLFSCSGSHIPFPIHPSGPNLVCLREGSLAIPCASKLGHSWGMGSPWPPLPKAAPLSSPSPATRGGDWQGEARPGLVTRCC